MSAKGKDGHVGCNTARHSETFEAAHRASRCVAHWALVLHSALLTTCEQRHRCAGSGLDHNSAPGACGKLSAIFGAMSQMWHLHKSLAALPAYFKWAEVCAMAFARGFRHLLLVFSQTTAERSTVPRRNAKRRRAQQHSATPKQQAVQTVTSLSPP